MGVQLIERGSEKKICGAVLSEVMAVDMATAIFVNRQWMEIETEREAHCHFSHLEVVDSKLDEAVVGPELATAAISPELAAALVLN
ncbi:hypothetical protein F0562_022493 [Nyssa sinensis]|uniref:Uncharacterized protein n=1 Tax=Nyssa sinensis TaxID=561372 RepID=A0A5J5BRV2_9ASTE|nr:hypothetical protein F0562_022493 [Nyssa sinensis]